VDSVSWQRYLDLALFYGTCYLWHCDYYTAKTRTTSPPAMAMMDPLDLDPQLRSVNSPQQQQQPRSHSYTLPSLPSLPPPHYPSLPSLSTPYPNPEPDTTYHDSQNRHPSNYPKMIPMPIPRPTGSPPPPSTILENLRAPTFLGGEQSSGSNAVVGVSYAQMHSGRRGSDDDEDGARGFCLWGTCRQ
jgi:hypothetical protein